MKPLLWISKRVCKQLRVKSQAQNEIGKWIENPINRVISANAKVARILCQAGTWKVILLVVQNHFPRAKMSGS